MENKFTELAKKIHLLQATSKAIQEGHQTMTNQNLERIILSPQKSIDEILYVEKHFSQMFAYFRSIKDTLRQDRYHQVLSALQLEKYKENDTVFEAGNVGRKMYFVIDGQLIVMMKENQKTKKIYKTLQTGDYFGEISLYHRIPRTATIGCLTNVSLAVLNYETYNKYICGVVRNNLELKLAFLRSVPLFDQWNILPLTLILHHIKEVQYTGFRKVYSEGDSDSNLYIVKSGEVRISKVFNDKSSKNKIRQGLVCVMENQYFGEHEFLKNQSWLNMESVGSILRETTATTTANCVILILPFQSFFDQASEYCNMQLQAFLNEGKKGILDIRQKEVQEQIIQRHAQLKELEKQNIKKFEIGDIVKEYIQSQKGDEIREFKPPTIYRQIKVSKQIETQKSPTNLKADLIQKYSFAIPYREDPLCSPIDTIRSPKSSHIRLASYQVDEKNIPTKFCNKQMLKIFILSRKDKIMMENKLHNKCLTRSPTPQTPRQMFSRSQSLLKPRNLELNEVQKKQILNSPRTLNSPMSLRSTQHIQSPRMRSSTIILSRKLSNVKEEELSFRNCVSRINFKLK